MEILFENFEQLADGPNGVQKLREMILQLAVQGKLTAEWRSSHPELVEGSHSASVLLDKIKAEKEKLIAAGKIKNGKPLPPIGEDEKLYDLPPSWEWVRLGEVTTVIRGITFPANEKSTISGEGRVACLRTTNVQYEIEWDDLLFIRERFVKRDDQFIQENDIVISMANSRELVGKVAIVNHKPKFITTFGGFLGVIRPFKLNPSFLMLLLRVPMNRNLLISSASQTTNIANISLTKLNPLVLSIPPLEEQNRIVAKVDQLMALCDTLEKQKERRAQKRVSIHKASIHQLLESKEQAEFNANWQRIQDNFDLLYEVPENVAELKQAILQLAVQGKLVPQNPADEPASVLLEKIKAEKALRQAQDKKRKEKPLPPIGDDEKPYELPPGWEWVRLQGIGTINPRNYIDDELDVSFSPMSLVPFEYDKSISFEIRKWRDLKSGFTHFRENDVLVAKITPSFENGKSVIAKKLKNGYGAGTTELHVFRGNPYFILPEYVYIYFKSPKFLDDGALNMTGTAGQQRVPKTYVAENPFPLPPLEEQKRIVAKVDALMHLCDGLEAKLSKSQEKAERLMNAVAQGVLSI